MAQTEQDALELIHGRPRRRTASTLPPSLRAALATSDEGRTLDALEARLASSVSEVRRLGVAAEAAGHHDAQVAREAAARGKAIPRASEPKAREQLSEAKRQHEAVEAAHAAAVRDALRAGAALAPEVAEGLIALADDAEAEVEGHAAAALAASARADAARYEASWVAALGAGQAGAWQDSVGPSSVTVALQQIEPVLVEDRAARERRAAWARSEVALLAADERRAREQQAAEAAARASLGAA